MYWADDFLVWARVAPPFKLRKLATHVALGTHIRERIWQPVPPSISRAFRYRQTRARKVHKRPLRSHKRQLGNATRISQLIDLKQGNRRRATAQQSASCIPRPTGLSPSNNCGIKCGKKAMYRWDAYLKRLCQVRGATHPVSSKDGLKKR